MSASTGRRLGTLGGFGLIVCGLVSASAQPDGVPLNPDDIGGS